MARQRNYRAEYARRVQLAELRGYSRSVARGHPKGDVIGVKLARALGVKPGTLKSARPAYVAPKGETLTLQERLEAAGFKDYFQERREEWLKGHADVEDLKFTSTTQQEFLTVAMNAGLSEREAYDLWFSPK